MKGRAYSNFMNLEKEIGTYSIWLNMSRFTGMHESAMDKFSYGSEWNVVRRFVSFYGRMDGRLFGRPGARLNVVLLVKR